MIAEHPYVVVAVALIVVVIAIAILRYKPKGPR